MPENKHRGMAGRHQHSCAACVLLMMPVNVQLHERVFTRRALLLNLCAQKWAAPAVIEQHESSTEPQQHQQGQQTNTDDRAALGSRPRQPRLPPCCRPASACTWPHGCCCCTHSCSSSCEQLARLCLARASRCEEYHTSVCPKLTTARPRVSARLAVAKQQWGDGSGHSGSPRMTETVFRPQHNKKRRAAHLNAASARACSCCGCCCSICASSHPARSTSSC